MPNRDTMEQVNKINTVNGVIGINYLTPSSTVEYDGQTISVTDGLNTYGFTPEKLAAVSYKQSVAIEGNIQDVYLSDTIQFEETESNFPKYDHATHFYDGGTTMQQATEIPKYFNGWQYMSSGTMTNLGSTFNQDMVINSENQNLNVYATWGDTNVIRVVLIAEPGNVLSDYGYSPAGTVTIGGTLGYNGTNALTNNFKKIFHKQYDNNYMSSQLEVSYIDIYGNPYTVNDCGSGDGCPDYLNGIKTITYYAVKDGYSPTITLSNLRAVKTGGNDILNAFVPKPYTVDQNYTYSCLVRNFLSKQYYDNLPRENFAFTSGVGYTYHPSGTFNTDMTVFIPVIPNTSPITVRPDDVINGVTTSTRGKVRIVIPDLEDDPQFSSGSVTKDCINGTTVTIQAQANPGYTFVNWTVEGSGTTYSSAAQSITINSSTANRTYVANFTEGAYTITYHKKYTIYT